MIRPKTKKLILSIGFNDNHTATGCFEDFVPASVRYLNEVTSIAEERFKDITAQNGGFWRVAHRDNPWFFIGLDIVGEEKRACGWFEFKDLIHEGAVAQEVQLFQEQLRIPLRNAELQSWPSRYSPNPAEDVS